MEGHIGIA